MDKKKNLQNFLEKIKKGVEEFNRYRSPEATASIADIKGDKIEVKVNGPFCRTCGFYDYFDDLRIELESNIGTNLEIANIEEKGEENYIVKFTFKKGGENYDKN
jgi:superoxide reductase